MAGEMMPGLMTRLFDEVTLLWYFFCIFFLIQRCLHFLCFPMPPFVPPGPVPPRPPESLSSPGRHQPPVCRARLQGVEEVSYNHTKYPLLWLWWIFPWHHEHMMEADIILSRFVLEEIWESPKCRAWLARYPSLCGEVADYHSSRGWREGVPATRRLELGTKVNYIAFLSFVTINGFFIHHKKISFQRWHFFLIFFSIPCFICIVVIWRHCLK